jgi:COP9 signalosome complex subunit 1
MARFESELLAAKSTTVKEAIRLGHMNIADFHYQRGNLNEALKSYSRTKDYCSQPRHAFDMHMNAISISIDTDQYRNIGNYVTKALSVSGPDAESKAKLKCVTGLQALHDGNFAVAGRLFCEVGLDLGGSFSNVIAVEDIVLYGVMCSMATLNRQELRSLFDQQSFKTQLELVPDVRQYILDYFSSKFAACKQFLQLMAPQWRLDIYLHKHVNALISNIIDKFVVAAFAPYSTMQLGRMSAVLDVNTEELENKVVRLIGSGHITAKIDKFQQTLVRTERNEKTDCIHAVASQSSQQAAYIKRSLMRLSLIKHNMCMTNADINENDIFGAESRPTGYGDGDIVEAMDEST